jgi:hypothetical protein
VPRRLFRVSALVTLIVALALSRARALTPNIDREQLDEALLFGRQATTAERQAFHDGYQRTLKDSLVRRISIVSEYRRVVLTLEEKMRLLDRNYGQRQMTQMLVPWRGLVEVIAEVQFHPQNTYIGVPLYDVLLVRLDGPAAGSVIVPEANDRRPHFGVYWDPPPMGSPWWPFPPTNAPVLGRSEPITGGWLQARFDAGLVTTGRFDIVVKDGAATLGSAQFDMGAIR